VKGQHPHGLNPQREYEPTYLCRIQEVHEHEELVQVVLKHWEAKPDSSSSHSSRVRNEVAAQERPRMEAGRTPVPGALESACGGCTGLQGPGRGARGTWQGVPVRRMRCVVA